MKNQIKRNAPFISEKFDRWIENTNKQYGVDIEKFVFNYLNKFFDNEDMWPRSHKIKLSDGEGGYITSYDYTKTNNLFGIDILYTKISNKPFIKSKKKYLEILMMYIWLSDFYGDEGYFEKYLDRIF